MPRRCTIERCLSRSDKPEHRGVTFHSFPFDSKTREVWIANCKIAADKNITKSVAVCSRHFRRADFTAVKGGKYTLKPGSVPTIFPWGKIEYTKHEGDKTSEDPKGENLEAEQSSSPAEQFEDTDSSNSVKRKKSDDSKENPKKMAKLESDPKSNSSVAKNPLKKDALNFVPGVLVEAQDFDGVWHTAKVDEVDNVEREVLLKFEEKEGKGYNKGVTEEWIPMNSSRLRPHIDNSIKPEQLFKIGEKVMARWTGARKFPATISKIFDDGTYEVLFDDGFIKVVKAAHISKVRLTKANIASTTIVKKEPESDIVASAKSVESSVSAPTTTTPKTQKSTKKSWPLISRDSLNLDELNLPHIPEDGEWCCHWVNDQPIGKEGFLMVGDHKKPTVIVDDWRLPPGWIKHMYQRSNVLGKWDVILVSPQGKRFRSKADLKQFIEEQGQVYNPDVYDFSIHRRRAKDISAYVYTKDYKPPPAVPKDAAYANVKPIEGGLPKSLISAPLNSSVLSPLSADETETKTSKLQLSKALPANDADSVPSIVQLEDGWVYVGGLKVQIIENLFRCPEKSCNKNFRKENHLQIHVKHYHQDLAKQLGACPNMQELALKRTIGETTEDSLPKNHLPNVQFFAKVHQQEIQAKTQRTTKSSLTGITTTAISTLGSPSAATNCQQSITNTSLLSPEKFSLDPGTAVIDDIESQSPIMPSLLLSPTTGHPTGDDFKSNEDILTSLQTSTDTPTKPVSPINVARSFSSSKAKKSAARKSNRQRTTKRFLNTSLKSTNTSLHDMTGNSSVSGANMSPRLNDFEETRHSFNATPDNNSKLPTSTVKKSKNLQNLIANECADANSHTTGSFPDQSQSPQYVRENGELIKIVKMRQEEIINCLCSYTEEDGLMIQCELCLCWQHGICNGIEKEKQVPEKYVCYICRNPQRGRESMKYIHDQDWLYDGKLPVANYHVSNPAEKEKCEILRKAHTLTGNLLETRKFLHSLKVKKIMAENKDHPKMYLWATKWEDDCLPKDEDSKTVKMDEGISNDIKIDLKVMEEKIQPTIPQPEAPIEPVECQYRLLEHIKLQQHKVKERLDNVEQQILELEMLDGEPEIEDCKIREILSIMIKDLAVMKKIAKINTVPKTPSY